MNQANAGQTEILDQFVAVVTYASVAHGLDWSREQIVEKALQMYIDLTVGILQKPSRNSGPQINLNWPGDNQ